MAGRIDFEGFFVRVFVFVFTTLTFTFFSSSLPLADTDVKKLPFADISSGDELTQTKANIIEVLRINWSNVKRIFFVLNVVSISDVT